MVKASLKFAGAVEPVKFADTVSASAERVNVVSPFVGLKLFPIHFAK